MNEFTILECMQELFDEASTAQQAAEIGQAMLAGRSLRMTDLANHMSGNSPAAYKRIQRFLQRHDPREVLGRLYQDTADFLIGDPTEIERAQAWKTEYVGTLKDGKTKGFWSLVLATPYRGRAIPCGLITYSSKTIANHQDSRNLNHFRAFEGVKDLLGEKPLVLDREFSYLELLLNLIEEQVSFVIRLNLGAHQPKFYDSEGQAVALTLSPGETVLHNQVWYKGKARVNLIGKWKKGLSEPLWVMTNLDRCYEGTEHRFPHNKICKAKRASRNHPITLFDKLLNHVINKTRILVEHVIGYLKKFRIVSELYRNRRASHGDFFAAVAGLINFRTLHSLNWA